MAMVYKTMRSKVIHDIKGAAERSRFCDKQLGRVSGITENLQSHAFSGQNIVFTNSKSKRGRPAGPSRSHKRSFILAIQKAKYEEKRQKDISIKKFRELSQGIKDLFVFFIKPSVKTAPWCWQWLYSSEWTAINKFLLHNKSVKCVSNMSGWSWNSTAAKWPNCPIKVSFHKVM